MARSLYRCLFLLFFMVMLGCTSSGQQGHLPKAFPEFFREGHRGTRGLMPENTIPAMQQALLVGANVLELDVHISRDQQVVVAHDPFINREFSLLPDGREIPPADARKYLLYQMDYAEIRRFDVGRKKNTGYPEQQTMPAYIPLLGELIDSVEHFARQHKLARPIYNIEIKSNARQDGVYQPAPAELVQLVMAEVLKKKIGGRYYVQSFDMRVLQEVKRQHPKVPIGFLTDSNLSLEQNLEKLGFVPQIYSPQKRLATPELVRQVQARGMKFIPWTVNTLAEMQSLKAMRVDGIITDYPNLLANL